MLEPPLCPVDMLGVASLGFLLLLNSYVCGCLEPGGAIARLWHLAVGVASAVGTVLGTK